MSQQELLKKVIQVLNQAGTQYMITAGKTLRWKWEAIYRCLAGLWSTVWEVRYRLSGTVGKEIKRWIIVETVSGRSGNSIIDTFFFSFLNYILNTRYCFPPWGGRIKVGVKYCHCEERSDAAISTKNEKPKTKNCFCTLQPATWNLFFLHFFPAPIHYPLYANNLPCIFNLQY